MIRLLKLLFRKKTESCPNVGVIHSWNAINIAAVILKYENDRIGHCSYLRLQLLTYIAHGFFMAFYNRPLVKDIVKLRGSTIYFKDIDDDIIRTGCLEKFIKKNSKVEMLSTDALSVIEKVVEEFSDYISSEQIYHWLRQNDKGYVWARNNDCDIISLDLIHHNFNLITNNSE